MSPPCVVQGNSYTEKRVQGNFTLDQSGAGTQRLPFHLYVMKGLKKENST